MLPASVSNPGDAVRPSSVSAWSSGKSADPQDREGVSLTLQRPFGQHSRHQPQPPPIYVARTRLAVRAEVKHNPAWCRSTCAARTRRAS